MSLKIGVIGTGAIGQEHIRRITSTLAGGVIVAVTDINLQQAQETVRKYGLAAKVYATGQELVAAADVEVVLVTSWGPTHEEFVLAAIAAGKPVFCEKPLATTAEGCMRIVKAEVAAGKGVRIDVEMFVNCVYGYDIQCEVVGETGIARLPEPSKVMMRSAAKRSVEILTDWKQRFIDAYDVELQGFMNGLHNGKLTGPSAWDGYAAAVAADACVKAQGSGTIEAVSMAARPAFYNA